MGLIDRVNNEVARFDRTLKNQKTIEGRDKKTAKKASVEIVVKSKVPGNIYLVLEQKALEHGKSLQEFAGAMLTIATKKFLMNEA